MIINLEEVNERKLREMYSYLKYRISIHDVEDFNPKYIAGCDVNYKEEAIASCVVWDRKGKSIVEEETIKSSTSFEYIPGRFTLRELPLVAKCMKKLKSCVDCLIVDGHGIAHPEKAGLATFAGYLFDLPAIGVAKSILVGEYRELDKKKGVFSDIIYNNEKVGEAICTANGVNPVFVSPGHKICFKTAREIVLELAIRSKYPEPLRLADIRAGKK